MTLTFITCSHNQVQYLERCIMSIINQSLPFEYEILLSDDNSTDGSWELALKMAEKYPQIKPIRCNTNDYPHYTTSQRSGYNRQCAYKHATGDYICFIDADDYYKEGTHVLQKLWELLESNPSCAAAMTNNWVIEDGASKDTMTYQDKQFTFQTGQIITPEDYINRHVFRSVTAFMFRRLEKEDVPISYLKGFYIDTVIAAYYMQFGDIVCLEDAESGYVYVQYKKSASHCDVYSAGDWAIWGSRCIYIPVLMPSWKPIYLRSRGYRGSMLAVTKRVFRTRTFNPEVIGMFEDLDVWIYRLTARKRTFADSCRLFVLAQLIKFTQYVPFHGKWCYGVIWKMIAE